MIVRQKQNVLEEISRLHAILGMIDRKIAYYDEMHSIQMRSNNESEMLQGPVLTASKECETLYKVIKPRSFRKHNEHRPRLSRQATPHTITKRASIAKVGFIPAQAIHRKE